MRRKKWYGGIIKTSDNLILCKNVCFSEMFCCDKTLNKCKLPGQKNHGNHSNQPTRLAKIQPQPATTYTFLQIIIIITHMFFPPPTKVLLPLCFLISFFEHAYD